MRNERRPKRTAKTTSASGGGRRSSRSGTTKPEGRSKTGARTDKPFKKDAGSFKKDVKGKKTFKSFDGDSKTDSRSRTSSKTDTPFKRGASSFKKDEDKKTYKSFGSGSKTDKSFKKGTGSFKKDEKDKKSFRSFGSEDKPERKRSFGTKPVTRKKFGTDKDEFTPSKKAKDTESFSEYRDKKKNSFEERKEYKRKTGIKTYTDKKGDRTYTRETEIVRNKDASKGFKKVKVYSAKDDDDGSVRLNKLIANAGICSRREADTFIQTGVVTVNGEVVTELGYKVKPGDRVLFGDKPVIGEKPVYILLNKPKDYITTSKDPQNRKTIYDLINGVKERVFPVGRLDRNTTGVLLLTNDGLIAEKLMHPRKGIKKIYHVEVDKRFAAPDMEQLKKGINLEDGFFTPDEVDYVDGMDKHHVGIEIHSGANRIVRRLFEALDYKVVKLDRVVYAGLDKKGLSRGRWRFLKDSEIHALKMM